MIPSFPRRVNPRFPQGSAARGARRRALSYICAFLYTFGTTSADFGPFFVISKNHGKIVNFL